jgi:hypothetical protein
MMEKYLSRRDQSFDDNESDEDKDDLGETYWK